MSDAADLQTQFIVGNLSGKVEGLTTRIGGVETKVDGIDVKLDQVLERMAIQKGGRKATVTIATLVATAFSAAATAVVSWLIGGHR